MATPREILGDLAEDVQPYGTDGVLALFPKMQEHLRRVKSFLQDVRNPAAVNELERLIACAAQTIALLEGE